MADTTKIVVNKEFIQEVRVAMERIKTAITLYEAQGYANEVSKILESKYGIDVKTKLLQNERGWWIPIEQRK